MEKDAICMGALQGSATVLLQWQCSSDRAWGGAERGAPQRGNRLRCNCVRALQGSATVRLRLQCRASGGGGKGRSGCPRG